MSFVAVRVFRGCRSLLDPASKAISSVAGGATKKPAAKTKANSKTKSKSPAKKTKNPTQTPTPTPRNTGIFKATPVSPALSQFLSTGETTRNDAVKEIWNYIKSHDLQNPADRREIICDEKLKKIFEGKDKVGFLEIAKLLAPHFAKTTA